MRIGVLALQGDFAEHQEMLETLGALPGLTAYRTDVADSLSNS